MSGFTRDPKHYGDRLVYEALQSTWIRHHRRCQRPDCPGDWLAHATDAGFEVVRSGSGYVALTGQGLTEGIDESALNTNALWAAVTGTPGTQSWTDTIRVVDRATAQRTPPSEPPALPSPEEVMAARSPAGGWTKATLAQWGIAWPPPTGWRGDLERRWREQRGRG
jgi:hypothetical protein